MATGNNMTGAARVMDPLLDGINSGKHWNGKFLKDYMPMFPMALLVGNEVRGLSTAMLAHADHIVEIPMSGKKESLNVSVAFGIAVHHIGLKIKTPVHLPR